MATTVRDIATSALQEIGVLASGETATAADAAAGLSTLNDLMDQWAAERLIIYTTTRTTWTIAASTQNYTLGTGGTINVARPVYIDHVNFIDTSPDTDVEYQLQPLTDDAWSRIPIKDLTSTFPTCWYYNPTFPLGTLQLWPIPTSSTLTGVLYAPQAVAEFADLDASVSLPPGYRRMLIKNVAVCLCPQYERDPRQDLKLDAIETKAVVKRSNKRLMDMTIEAGALVQGQNSRYTYDINTGP
jgi:hypothetical protein